MFAGALCAAVAALMTALKTGNVWLWPCVALLVVHRRAARASTCSSTRTLHGDLTAEQAARWEVALPDRRDALCGCARALVPGRAARQRRCRRPHDLRSSVTLGYMAAGGGRTYGRPWIFHLQMLLACGPLTVALAAARQSLLHRHGAAERAVLLRAEAHLHQPAADFRPRADRARTRGGAGRASSTPR